MGDRGAEETSVRGPAPASPTRVEWLTVAGDPELWRSLGLVVDPHGLVPLMGTSLRVVAPHDRTGSEVDSGSGGLTRWALSSPTASFSVSVVPDTGTDVTENEHLGPVGEIDGLVTEIVAAQPPVVAMHDLGASGLDHVVVLTPELERTSEAIALATGCQLRRIREVGSMRQGFHRIGPGGLIVELVERPEAPPGPAAFWGLVFNVDDLDSACALLGPDRISSAKDAVQPGRRIATVRSDVGLGLPVALMSL